MHGSVVSSPSSDPLAPALVVLVSWPALVCFPLSGGRMCHLWRHGSSRVSGRFDARRIRHVSASLSIRLASGT